MAEDIRNYKARMASTEAAQKDLAAKEDALKMATVERQVAKEKLDALFAGATTIPQAQYDSIMKTASDNYIKAEGNMRTAEANLKQRIAEEEQLFEANKPLEQSKQIALLNISAKNVTKAPIMSVSDLRKLVNAGYENAPAGITPGRGRMEQYPPDTLEQLLQIRLQAAEGYIRSAYLGTVNIATVESGFQRLEDLQAVDIMPAGKDGNILNELKEKMFVAVQKEMKTMLASTDPNRVNLARALYQTRADRLPTGRDRELEELIMQSENKESDSKKTAARQEVLRLITPVNLVPDRYKSAKDYVNTQESAGNIDPELARELRTLISTDIDTVAAKYALDIKNGMIAGATIEDKIRTSITTVEGTPYPASDSEFETKLRDKTNDLKSEEKTNNESAEKSRKEKNSATFKNSVVNWITKASPFPPGAAVVFNIDGAAGPIPLTVGNLSQMRTELAAQQTAGNIDNGLTIDSIQQELITQLKSRISEEMNRYSATGAGGAIAILDFADVNRAILAVSNAVAADYLPNTATTELISAALEHHKALVEKYKTLAKPGLPRAEWRLAALNIPAQDEAEDSLYRDAIDPKGAKYTSLINEINAMIEKRDPAVVDPAGSGMPDIARILAYADSKGDLNWMEREVFIVGTTPRRIIPVADPLLQTYYDRYRTGAAVESVMTDINSVGEMQRYVKREVLDRLTVPPLTAVQKMKIENDFKFALKDARLAERIAKWERARGTVNKMAAMLSGSVVGTTIVAAAGIGLAVSPAALIIIAGLGIPGGVRYAAGLLDKIDRANRDMLALEEIPEDLRISVAEAGQEINDMFKKPETFDAKKITDRIAKLRKDINAVKISKPENKNQRAA